MEPRPKSFYYLSAFFVLFIVFLYGPTLTIGILSFQGPGGGLTFPMRGVSLHWFRDLFEQQAVGRYLGFIQSFSDTWANGNGHHGCGIDYGRASLPQALCRIHGLILFGYHFAGDPFDPDLSGGWSDLVSIRS